MGQLKSDGKAINVTAPAGVIAFGELVRIDGWNGISLDAVAAADTARGLAIEVGAERIWYVELPAAVTGARGTYLYWAGGAGFKYGPDDLSETPVGAPCAIVEEAKDANDIAGIRVLNSGVAADFAGTGPVQMAVIAGGAAGAHAVTGILSTDNLISVVQFNIAADSGDNATGNKVDNVVDLTSEFSVSDDDEIDNTGGTDTTGDVLLVTWQS